MTPSDRVLVGATVEKVVYSVGKVLGITVFLSATCPVVLVLKSGRWDVLGLVRVSTVRTGCVISTVGSDVEVISVLGGVTGLPTPG